MPASSPTAVPPFRSRIGCDARSGYYAAPHRYRLHLTPSCPYCLQIAVTHTLLGLDDILPVTWLPAVPDNDGKGGGPVLGNDELGYGWTTYPERLERAGISWRVYQDIGDGLDPAGRWGWIDDAYRGTYGDNSLLYFDQYREAKPGDPLYDKARTGTDVRDGDGLFDQLRADVTAGRLPQVSWIVAPEAFSEHSN